MLPITYLVANYNNSQYIRDCIASLHAQTSPHWLCLIADDKSTDDSLAVIRTLLAPKVKLIENEKNVGYIKTLIKLIEQAPTDIVGILDPDDALEPEATACVLAAYQAHPESGFVYTTHHFYREDWTRTAATGLSSVISAGGTSLMHGYVGHLKTFRRTAYAKTAGLDPSILFAEDRDLVYKLEEVTPFTFIDQPLYKYRQVPNSVTNSLEKRQIGIRNHRLAYQNALQRRNIRGLKKLIYLAYFNERYSDQRITPASLIAAGRHLKRFLLWSWR